MQNSPSKILRLLSDPKSWSNLALKDMARLKPENTHLNPWLSEFKKELKTLALPDKINFCFDDEWYYADGSNWISIPYYLASEALIKYVKNRSLEVEGTNRKEFLKLLRHEYAHYFESLYSTRKWKIRRNSFGSKASYPKSYLPIGDENNYVQHLANHYAQSHPDEDFAESFAVFIEPKQSWKTKYRNKTVYKKLISIGYIIETSRLRKKRPLDTKNYFPLSNNKEYLMSLLAKTPRKIKTIHIKQAKSYEIRLSKKWKLSAQEAYYLAVKIQANKEYSFLTKSPKALELLEKKTLKNKSHYILM